MLISHNDNNGVTGEPEIQDNGDFTQTATWEFDNPLDFVLTNTTINNGAVNLSLPTYWWNQTTQIDFDSGTHNKTNSTGTGDVILANEMKNVNIIRDGVFSYDENWTFESGDNIQSFYNGTQKSAQMDYSYHSGVNVQYLEPPTSSDDGFAVYWSTLPDYQFDNSSALADIGFYIVGTYPQSRRAFFYFDLGSIPVAATIENVTFYTKLETASTSSNHLIDIMAMDIHRIGATAQEIYMDVGNGTMYIDNSDYFKLGQSPGYYEFNLGPQAALDVKNNLSRGWFGIGILEEGDNDNRSRISTVDAMSNHPQLNVTYNNTTPVTFDETAFVNQTFHKPNVTPSDPKAVNLSFDYIVEKFANTTAELVIEIDGSPVWGPVPLAGVSGWNTQNADLGLFMTQARDYEICLQLHMNVLSQTNVDCIVKYDNINITTLGYAWKGSYASMVLDPGTHVFWDSISWNRTSDSETGVSLRSRNSPDGALWGPWSGDYPNYDGNQISTGMGRKLQFSANLTTTNYTKSPMLSDVNISYKKYSPSGIISMKSDFVPANLRNWGKLSWIAQSNGQGLSFWYSLNSGFLWNQTTDGNLSAVNTSGGKIMFKVEFSTANGTISPTLFKLNLTYEISELPTLYGGVSPNFGFINSYYNFTVRYSDPENEPPLKITVNITSGPSHLGSFDMFVLNASDTNYTDGKWYFYNDTGFLRGSNYTFHFAAMDPSSIWSIGSTISGPLVLNSPPKIISENKLGAQAGILYYNDYDAEDLEDQGALVWTLSTNATWLVIDSISGNLSGVPPPGDQGSYWVNVMVSDGQGGFDNKNFTLIVGDTEPPNANAGPDQTKFEDDFVQFNGSLSTDNIGIFNYTWYFGDGTAGYGVSPIHVYTKKGQYLVALIVRDVLGNEDIDLINMTVLNKPPYANAGNDTSVFEGSEIFFNANKSYDTPSDNNSLYYFWDFDEDGQFDDHMGMNVSFTWYSPKNTTVYLMVVDDDGAYSEDSVNVKVLNVPPTVDISDSYSGEKGSEIIIIASSYDPGDVELMFRWDWENDGIWDTTFSTNNIIRHSWEQEGIYTLKVEVWDQVDIGTDSAQVIITRNNIPPILGDLGSRQIRYNNPYTIDLTSFITDEDTPISEMVVSTSDPEHVSISGVKITLIYPEDMIGDTVDVVVTVSDKLASDSSILTVLITQNYPPTLKIPIADVMFEEDGQSPNIFNLNNHFEDIDGEKLLFEYIITNPNLIVIISANGDVTFKATTNWAGSTVVRFLAQDPSGAFADARILVTVSPINDPPIILKQIKEAETTITEGGNWTIDLDDYFFDVDSFNITFSCNNPDIHIDPVTHEATWVIGTQKELLGVRFTANDGEHKVSLEPVDIRVVGQDSFNWLYIILALLLGAIIFAVYGEIRYRYTIEEVFLVDNAGVLLVHLSQWESKAIDAKLVSGMLTAVQEFVKDSFRSNSVDTEMKISEGALGKLEYGDFQIVIERGAYTYLSAVISGYDNKRLRKKMMAVVDDFEGKYSHVLADWDGDMARFDGAEEIVARLLKNNKKLNVPNEAQAQSQSGPSTEESDIMNPEDLPHGDFGDIPSYYDESGDANLNENDEEDMSKDKEHSDV